MTALLECSRTAVRRPLRHFGISLGHLTEGSARDWIRSLRLPAVAQACTHRAEFPFPHVAVSIALPAGMAPPEETAGSVFLEAAIAAGNAHAAGRSGRAVHFRGWSALSGPVTVGEILNKTDVVRVTVGTVSAGSADVLDAGAGLTPHWVGGELVVRAEPGPDGVLVRSPGFGH